MRWKVRTFLLIMLLGFISFPFRGFAATAADDLGKANKSVIQALQLVQEGDINGASKQYEAFRSTWLSIEEGIKKQSSQAYRDIEDSMGQVQFAFAQQPANKEKVETALQKLKDVDDKFIAGKFSATSTQKDEGNT
ncbi:iron permease, partial [Bacillus paramycoides]